MMTILLIILAVALAGMTVSGVICYRRFALPNMLPLAEQDLEVCRQIVSQGRGVPWVCRHALKTGLCPCQPCEKLERARDGEPVRLAGARPAHREAVDRNDEPSPRLSQGSKLDLWVETLR